MAAPEERVPGVDVLIADDDAPTRSLLRRLLERRGYTCVEAEDGPSAVALARAAAPRCVLLDLVMPGLDGLSVARRLRADPRTRSIHIHCLTGRADDEARALARDAGCEAFLVKPVEPGRVLELVHRETEPPPTGWVSGLTLAEAQDLLDWLERCGCTHLEMFWEGDAVTVRCVCPPGLRLSRDGGGAVRLFPAVGLMDFVCPRCGSAQPVNRGLAGWTVRCNRCGAFEPVPDPPPVALPDRGAIHRGAGAVLATVGRAFRRAVSALGRSGRD